MNTTKNQITIGSIVKTSDYDQNLQVVYRTIIEGKAAYRVDTFYDGLTWISADSITEVVYQYTHDQLHYAQADPVTNLPVWVSETGRMMNAQPALVIGQINASDYALYNYDTCQFEAWHITGIADRIAAKPVPRVAQVALALLGVR